MVAMLINDIHEINVRAATGLYHSIHEYSIQETVSIAICITCIYRSIIHIPSIQ